MPDTQLKDDSIKQKVKIGLLVVVLAVVAWQVKGLFSGGGSAAPEPQPQQVSKPAAMTANAPASNATAANPAATGNSAIAPQTSTLPPDPLAKLQPADTGTSDATQTADNNQEYLSLINQLEKLKLEREIAETNQAIAAAQLAIRTAEKSKSDLLTTPTLTQSAANTPPVVTPPTNYANQLQGESTSSPLAPPPGAMATTTTTTTIISDAPSADYSVISVNMQLYKWSAVIGYQGKLYNVSVGDMLPPDNSMVSSISRNGVVLKKNGKIRKIPVTSSI